MNERIPQPGVSRFSRPCRAIGNTRGGFSIVELLGTCALLGVLFSISVPMFLVIARERHATEQRQFALQHAANLLEDATVRAWSELTPGELTVPPADVDLKAMLPGVERTVVVNQIEGEPPSRQVFASIRWETRPGQFAAPVQLSAWVYPPNKVQ